MKKMGTFGKKYGTLMVRLTALNIIRQKYTVLGICLLLSVISFSQSNISFFNQIKNEYPDDSFLQLSQQVFYSIQIKNDKLDIKKRTKEKFIFLKNSPGLPMTRTVYSSTFSELIDYEANSYVLEKNKYKRIPVKSYDEKSNVDYDIFYDDVKELSFSFPGITTGTIIELNTVHKINEPRLIRSEFLKWFYPIKNFELIIECDTGIDLDILKINFEKNEGNYSFSTEKKKYIHKWKKTNLEKLIPEYNEPNLRYFAPHIIPVIRSYNSEGRKIDLLKNTASLYSWYYSFIEEIENENIDNNLKQIADSIIQGCSSDIEKVEKLFYWVQNNIKYIAFEYGLGGFVPRKPNVVMNNHYGDCKDKTSVLYSLLKSAGIPSYFTWIGSTDIPYSYHDVPTPSSDNHMILTYIANDRYYFLDATGKFLHMNYPTSFIQGKEALIGKTENEFEIKKVPTLTPEDNIIKDTVHLKINDQTLTGQGDLSVSGYFKIDLQNQLADEDHDRQKDIIEARISKGSNKFVLTNFSKPDLTSYIPRMNISYDFNLENYMKKIDGELYLNMNLERHWLNYKLKKDRKHPMIFRFRSSRNYNFILEIPDGYKVDYLPENYSFTNENFNYDISYTLKDNYIIYKHNLEINDLLIEKKQFNEWNNFISDLEKAYKQTVLLKRYEK